jgi:sugar (pentulose or hexulose) kinase
MLGAGVIEPGTGVDITGTSTVIAALSTKPVARSDIASFRGVCGGWMPFSVLDAGGDSMHWARSLLNDSQLGFRAIVDLAATAPAGAEGLLFLPYLNGERLGDQANSRGQLFGLTRRHDRAHVYRAVLEGLAFAARRHIRRMRAAGIDFDRLVATGGGIRHPLWLAIKTGIYAEPLAVTEYADSGIVGCAALAGLGTGVFADLAEAVTRLARLRPPLQPDPALAEYYSRLGEVCDRLYESSGELCLQLDELTLNG